MHRLRDEAGDDPVAVRGIELLRRTPPAARSPESKRRVWRSIQLAHTSKAQGFRLPKLRIAAVVIGVLCVAGSAGAVIAARRWIAPIFVGISSLRPGTPNMQGHTPPAARAVAVRHTPSSSLPVPKSPALQAQVAPFAAAPANPTGTAGRPPAHRVPPRRVSPSAAVAYRLNLGAAGNGKEGSSEPLGGPPAATAAAVQERTEVLDAMVALRRDRDPVTAGRLLDTYLAARPHGALREEALALAIEAAAARSDIPSARRLARQYRSAYPAGRFREFAEAAAGP
jgi:hypothetical protein